MKKMFGICLVLLSCFMVVKVSAAEYYYYTSVVDNERVFRLCEDNDNNCVLYTDTEIRDMGGYFEPNKVIMGPGLIYNFRDIATPDTTIGPGYVTPSDGETTKKETKAPATDTCERLKEPLMFLGHIVTIFKILIPILLIVFGIMDFFKAVTAGKDDEIKKSTKTFGLRILAGVVIFFLPTIVSFIFSLIDSWGEFEGDFNACQKCVFRVSQCK